LTAATKSPSRDGAPSVRRYPALSIGLHWLSALAVVTAFAVAWTRAALDEPGPRASLMALHQCAGILVLALLLVRVGTRLATFRAMAPSSLPRLMRWAAAATHLALYALLLAQPLLGWALTNAHGHDVRLPGLPPLPALVAADPDLADTLDSLHVGVAWVLAGGIVLHVLAALFHHFVRRDDVLRAMLPVADARGPRPAGEPVRAPRPEGSRSY
jgi:cytochrome b561